MTRGRKKLPQEILEIRGTARKDRQRPSSVSGSLIQSWGLECTQFSGYKSMNERAKRIFASACQQCIAMKILSPAYLMQLALYARECDLYLSCVEDLEKNGRYIESTNVKTGAVSFAENPSFRQANQALVQIRAIGSNFGFSPVDSMKLKLQTEEDPMAKIKRMMLEVEYDGPDNQ